MLGGVANSSGDGTVKGMLGGVAIGFDFNKPEASLHVKGNMLVSSNVNITSDFVKVYSTNTSEDSIKLLSLNGGITVNINKSLIEKVNENKTTHISGNLIETLLGTKTTTVLGNVRRCC
jgi:hypothetical protein